jgi:formate dehydrogenase major subunit
MLRRNSLSEAFDSENDWEKALDFLAERLRKIRARHGPRSLMIGCDPEAGLDFFIGAMRFARLWGTADVYHPLYATRGISTGPNPVIPSAPRCTEWGRSKSILLVEADLATTHPVAFGRLLEARDKGAEIIALDSRFTPTMSKADVSHRIRPDSGNRFALALLKAMLEEDLQPLEPAKALFDQFDGWKASFESLAYDDLEKMTGLETAKVVEIARRLGAKNPVTVITGKRLSGRQNSGIWRTMVLARGWDILEGGGWYPLDAGLPPFLPFTDIDELDSRRNAPEDDKRFGGDIEETGRVAEDSENPVKALISSGNCLYDFMSCMRGLAKGSELNIHFGAFPNETVNFAHFVIPATLWPEREALSFTNDRAIRWADRIIEPAGDRRSGLDFWTGLAQRLADVRHLEWKAYFPWKKEDGSAAPRSFYGWLLDQSPFTSGCGIDRIRANEKNEPIHWPIDPAALAITACPIEAFVAPADLQPLFQAEEGDLFPLVYQATRTISRSGDADNFRPLTLGLEDADAVQIHPDTAGVLGIESGDPVLVHGPGETFEAWALITRMVPRWLIWSARRLASNCAVVCKKGRSCEEASRILKEFLR